VTIHDPTQVTSCCNLLAPVRQLSSNSRSPRMSFSQVEHVFIVEHYLASRSYLTCQNEFRDTFPDSPVPNIDNISSREPFPWHRNSSRVASNMRKRVDASIAERGGHFQHFIQHCFLFSDFIVIYFLAIEHVSELGCVTFWSSCTCPVQLILDLIEGVRQSSTPTQYSRWNHSVVYFNLVCL
jgi:hypothetical protein